MPEQNKTVSDYYDAVAADYHDRYNKDILFDHTRRYPANYFRLQLLLNSFMSKGVKRVVEVGVGEGTPLVTLGKAGIETWGFDISKEMVEKSKQTFKKNGMDPGRVIWGDIQDPLTYVDILRSGQFDALMAMGVMPHIENDDIVLENMSKLIRPGGSVFIEFRNKLFSLFTFNRYTADFILNDLLKDVSSSIKEKVESDLETRLRMDVPQIREKVKGSDAPGYDAVLSKFHNPFEVVELFKRHCFNNIRLQWYHYHPAMPYLASQMPELFHRESIRLEHEQSNWRGFFLCSAFVVEAIKGENL